MKKKSTLWNDTTGYAVVEATILFPIMMMVFAGLVLLAIYLPTRMVLQQATQYAATALATEQSDTWLNFDEDGMEYYWSRSREGLPNVYVALISSFFKGNINDTADTIVQNIENNSVVSRAGELTVKCDVVNYVIYKEIVVTATRSIPMPVDLSYVNFPSEIPITVTSTAVVQNGDEFVRNIDLAAEFISYLDEKYDLKFDELGNFLSQAWDFLGI